MVLRCDSNSVKGSSGVFFFMKFGKRLAFCIAVFNSLISVMAEAMLSLVATCLLAMVAVMPRFI